MPSFNLDDAMVRAAERFDSLDNAAKPRRARADRGRSRMPEPIRAFLNEVLSGVDRPRFLDIETEVARFSKNRGLPCPSRATLYHYFASAPAGTLDWNDLPIAVQRALYNLGEGVRVPAHQVVFAAFNYGDIEAISFASGLPWLALYQADRVRGWRPKSHSLLRAVMKGRGL
jgi:hypothetical protein